MNFLRFFFSKLFVKQLALGWSLIVLLYRACVFGALNCYTQHGKHTQVPDIEALSLETVAYCFESI